MASKTSRSIAAAHSKKLVIDATWAIDPRITHDDILTCAQHAIMSTSVPELQLLQHALPHVHTAQQPVSTGDASSVAWATWHHGSDFYTYWCGDVETILHHAELTDTERELVLLRARKVAAQGLSVYATGAKFTHEPPKKLATGIEHIGLVMLRPNL